MMAFTKCLHNLHQNDGIVVMVAVIVYVCVFPHFTLFRYNKEQQSLMTCFIHLREKIDHIY